MQPGKGEPKPAVVPSHRSLHLRVGRFLIQVQGQPYHNSLRCPGITVADSVVHLLTSVVGLRCSVTPSNRVPPPISASLSHNGAASPAASLAWDGPKLESCPRRINNLRVKWCPVPFFGPPAQGPGSPPQPVHSGRPGVPRHRDRSDGPRRRWTPPGGGASPGGHCVSLGRGPGPKRPGARVRFGGAPPGGLQGGAAGRHGCPAVGATAGGKKIGDVGGNVRMPWIL